jgi:hypothetical protein
LNQTPKTQNKIALDSKNKIWNRIDRVELVNAGWRSTTTATPNSQPSLTKRSGHGDHHEDMMVRPSVGLTLVTDPKWVVFSSVWRTTVTPVTPVTDSKSAQNSQEHKTTIRDYPKVQFRCFQTQMNTNIKAQTLWINDPKLCFDLLQILSSLILNKNIYNHSYAARPNWLDSNHLIPYMFWSIIKSLIHNQKAMHWRALFMLNENKKFTICLDSSQRQNIMGSDRIRKPVYAKRWSKIIWDQF